MLVELASRRGVGDEGAELRVLHRHLSKPREIFATKVTKATKVFLSIFVNFVFFVAKNIGKQLFEQAVEGDAGGVGDVGEEDVFDRRIRRGEDLRHQRRAERLALTVDVGVVGAGKVDALEGAATLLWFGGLVVRWLGGWWTYLFAQTLKRHFALRRNDERLAGREFLHRLRRYVEGGLDRGALAGDRHHVVVDVVESGADAARVARRECPAVAGRAAERPGAVGFGERGGECSGNRSLTRRHRGTEPSVL